METLQNFGTRYTLAPNRKDIAIWIMNKFISYGYSNVQIDSFMTVADNDPYQVHGYLSKQYNVIATLQGSVYPDTENIVGAHYDCALQLPYDTFPTYGTAVPGADDNASGVAGVMEIARVLAQNNFHTESSIKFIAFAGEELGFFGSEAYSDEAYITKKNINMMINLDCIAGGDTANWKIAILKHQGAEWLYFLGEKICQNYSSLQPWSYTVADDGSDSYTFYKKGFPSTFLHERYWSQIIHTLNDSVSNYNMSYCSEITRVALGMLVYEQEIPVVKLKSIPEYHNIRLVWNKVHRDNLIGYNVYKSLNSGQGFQKINSVPLSDTFYLDTDVLVGTDYYYMATSIDSANNESEYSNEVLSAPLEMSNGILVVDDSEYGLLIPTDSEIDAFYNFILSGYYHVNYDTRVSGAPTFATLAKYSSVLWHINYLYQTRLFKSKDAIKKYLDWGGNIFFTLYQPSNAFEQSTTYPINFSYGNFEYEYLKINNFYYDGTSLLRSAIPSSSGYDTLNVDTLKTLSQYDYNMLNIEAIGTSHNANVIYTFSSEYDSLTPQGNMTGMPIGIEFDSTYKIVLLSFPLYYMDSLKAKALTEHVFTNIFNEPLSVNEFENKNSFYLFPNPCSDYTVADIFLEKQNYIELFVYDISGRKLKQINLKNKPAGHYQIKIDMHDLANGIYFFNIDFGDGVNSAKIIVAR
jgi:hypothetical protein